MDVPIKNLKVAFGTARNMYKILYFTLGRINCFKGKINGI